MRREQLPIATPCEMTWAQLRDEGGDHQARRCDQCKLRVYNLSMMTEREAARLVERQRAQGLCVIYVYDEQGKVYHQPSVGRIYAQAPGKRRRAARKFLAAAALITPMLTQSVACGGISARPYDAKPWMDHEQATEAQDAPTQGQEARDKAPAEEELPPPSP